MLKLEELRKEHGYSQEEFAKKVNMTQQGISAYEKNKREPDIETLKLFANFFDVSIDYLVGNSDVRNFNDLQAILNLKESEHISNDELISAIKFYKEIKDKFKK